MSWISGPLTRYGFACRDDTDDFSAIVCQVHNRRNRPSRNILMQVFFPGSFLFKLTRRQLYAPGHQCYLDRRLKADYSLSEIFDLRLLRLHCSCHPLDLVVHADDLGDSVPHLLGNTHQATFLSDSILAMRRLEASMNVSASSIAWSARSVALSI